MRSLWVVVHDKGTEGGVSDGGAGGYVDDGIGGKLDGISVMTGPQAGVKELEGKGLRLQYIYQGGEGVGGANLDRRPAVEAPCKLKVQGDQHAQRQGDNAGKGQKRRRFIHAGGADRYAGDRQGIGKQGGDDGQGTRAAR
ncbi:hypothetical protein SDC9_85448 [bioreactor metagenome]|uniref:Uncharacterized protein n=1 Tax=bioreactor metagenome TaxID=1076179 RepID=A0A644ZEU7_9ZZZZ